MKDNYDFLYITPPFLAAAAAAFVRGGGAMHARLQFRCFPHSDSSSFSVHFFYHYQSLEMPNHELVRILAD